MKEALLVMDMQPRIVGMIADPTALLENIRTVIDAAHTKSIPVIYIVVTFRPGFPEVSPNNKSFSTIKQNQSAFADADQSIVPADIAPHQKDIVVTKRRVSAFTGSDLEVVLRSLGIERLVLTGIATSGVVLSTLREAADKDYQLLVLSDCCADMDAEVHEVLLTKVFPRQASVLTSDNWIKNA
jgi:nicotinamidase-related amidase